MAIDTILQHPILTNFAFPFLIIFFIVYAVLEKTNLFGEGKTQLNAFLAFIIGLIFVGSVFPKEVVNNLILFLTVAIASVFVVLVLWGFAAGGEMKNGFLSLKGVKWTLGVVIVIAVIVALLWAVDVGGGVGVFEFLFEQDWSESFWTNFVFMVVIAAALAAVITSAKKASS
jgi:hypothetical protein|tara:strand:+ start:5033 stop:5548 length:516 start_codon:yes stop_codon:yes gene_type:complete